MIRFANAAVRACYGDRGNRLAGRGIPRATVHRPRTTPSASAAAGSASTSTSTSTSISNDATDKQSASPSTGKDRIPGPGFFGSLRAIPHLQDNHFLRNLRAEYGDLVRLWPGQEMVFVFDPEKFMEILRQEWSLPHGASPQVWPLVQYYQAKCPDTMPMMLRQGEDWKKPRHNIQKHVFKHQVADEYLPGLTQVSTDAVKALRTMPEEDLHEFLIHVSFEMLSDALLKRRMGLVDGTSGPLERDFVKNAVKAFHTVGPLLVQPELPRSLLMKFSPTYQGFDAAMDRVWDIGMEFLDQAESDEEHSWEGSIFARLTRDGTMGRQERLVNLVTLLQAGVDTTSNTLEFILYQLAKNPEEQAKVRAELQAVLPEDPTEGFRREHLADLPYFKAFLREVQRVTPTATATIRRIPFEVQVGNEYTIPPNTLIFFQGDPYNWDPNLVGGDPSVFSPERWIAANEVVAEGGLSSKQTAADPRQPILTESGVVAPAPILSHPLMATAFMVGPRMCVGARLAQNEIHSFVSAVCRNFELTLDPPNQKIGSAPRLVNTPFPSPRIRFDPVSTTNTRS